MPALKLKVLPRFASNVVGGTGITATKSNGVWTISLSGSTVQSVVDDTNVVGDITSGALTLGWDGVLSAARGGAGTGTSGYALFGNGAGVTPTYQGFLQSGTGGVTRGWQDKARESVSVLDFIPVAEHAAILAYTSITDVTTYFAAAITALGSGRLKVPRGRFCLTAINLNAAVAIEIDGSGWDTSRAGTKGTVLRFTNAAGTGRMIDGRGAKGCAIRNLSIEYTSATFDGDGIDFSNSSFTTWDKNVVEGCSFFQNGSSSHTMRSWINAKDAVDVLIRNNRFAHAQYGVVGAPAATVTITLASPGVVTWTNHTVAADYPISFETTGTLPTGLSAGTTYYVKTVLSANTFTVSATVGGAAINTSVGQSGVHTCTENWSRPAVSDSISVTLEGRNDFVAMDKWSMANPGINWNIQGNNFEPTLAGVPNAIATLGSNQWIGTTFDNNTCSDATADGTWVKIGISLGGSVSKNSFAGDGSHTIVALQVGALGGLIWQGNYHSALTTAIKFTAGFSGLATGGNNFSNVTNKTVGRDFGDTSSDFATNYPDILSAITTPATNDSLTMFDTSAAVQVRILLQDMMGVITQLTSKTAMVTTDEFAIWDSIGSVAKKVTYANFLANLAIPVTSLGTVKTTYRAGGATAVDFNSVADTAITISLPTGVTKYRMSSVIIFNASGDISAASWALYSAPAAGGTAIRAITACSVTTGTIDTAGNMQAAGASVDALYDLTTVYFRITTAAGVARTANVMINITPIA